MNPPAAEWKIEIYSWPRLGRERRREVLYLLGEVGGEWWGDGQLTLPTYLEACRFTESARARGFFVRVVAPPAS